MDATFVEFLLALSSFIGFDTVMQLKKNKCMC